MQFEKMKSSKYLNSHYCELKQDHFALPKLAPNAPWFQRFARHFKKWMTLDPDLPVSKKFFRNRSTLQREQRRHLDGPVFIIHPFSKINRIRQALISCLWITEMFVSPIVICFIHTIKTNNQFILSGGTYATLFFYRYVLSTSITLMNMLHFITGYVDTGTNHIVIEPTKIIKHYLLTYFFIDFLYNPKYLIYDYEAEYLQMINVLCFMRVSTCWNYLKVVFLSIPEVINECIKLFTLTALMINAFTCAYYGSPALFNKGKFPIDTWQVRGNFVPYTRDDLERNVLMTAYGESFVVVCCNFFGAGDGPMTISYNDLWQKAILIVVMITGRIWTLYTLASALKLFSVMNISASKYEENYYQLDAYMKLKKLPQHLRKKINEYYSYKFQNHFFNEPAILNTLSTALKGDLLLYNLRKVMRQVELFKLLPKSVVGVIIANCKPNVYLSGDVICAEGELYENVFFISSGSLAVSKDEKELQHIGDGDEIGCINIFERKINRYTFTYTAIETTEILFINLKVLRGLLVEHMESLKTNYMKKLQESYAIKLEMAQRIDYHDSDFLREIDEGLILEHRRLKPTI